METATTPVTETTSEGVVRTLGRHAVERGYAEPAYVDAVVEREEIGRAHV